MRSRPRPGFRASNQWFALSFIALCCTTEPIARPQDGSPEPASAPTALAPAGAALDRLLFEPPPGRWRLAPPSELNDVVLWLSQILIRHDRVRPESVSLTFADWRAAGPAASRTRDEALRLAQSLQERAAKTPERFAELAREFSEDPTTKDAGGSLGGITASQFMILPHLLDVLETVPIGGVAPVVETDWGFHVLCRSSPPPPAILSGQRIVVGYDEAPWLIHSARGAIVKRSRSDAMTLAQRIYSEASRAPEQFDRLVQQYSENADAARNGDLGTWSSREPTQLPRELELLQRLEPGQVAPPMDSLFGFEIIRRTEDRPRATYEFIGIRLMFDASVPDGDPSSAAAVLQQARSLYAQFDHDPARFDSLRAEYCCSKPSVVIDGRSPHVLVSQLARLQPGQIAREPFQFGSAYVIPKLLSRGAEQWPTHRARLELPAPVSSNAIPVAATARDGLAP